MELRQQLELVEVAYNEGNTQATLTYLDEENGEVLEVKFNKQSYDQQAGKFVKDDEKAKQVEEWCKEYFDCSCCGQTKSYAGSIQYGEYRLCNDCVLLAETGFALGKIKDIPTLLKQGYYFSWGIHLIGRNYKTEDIFNSIDILMIDGQQ